MPREFSLVSSRPSTLADLVEAAGEVDGSLALRFLDEGSSLQLVDADDVAVLTIDQSREVHATVDLELIIGPLPFVAGCWWTSATAPWGAAGAAGVRVVDELSVLLGATVRVTGVDGWRTSHG